MVNEKNEEFVNRYKDPSTRNITISNRIENTQQRIKGKINDLVVLGLMRQIGSIKQSKGTGTITLYRYTAAGRLFAYIIESFDSKKRAGAEKQIYFIIHDRLFKIRENSQSDVIFYSRYFEKVYENKFFRYFCYNLRRLLSSGLEIEDLRLFFQYAMLPKFKDGCGGRVFVKLWGDTINELEPNLKELVLYQLKAKLEDLMLRKVEDIKTFQQMCYKLRDKPDHFVLEGTCRKCRLTTCTPIHSILEYYQAMVYPDETNKVLTTCPICNTKSLEVPCLI